MSFGEAKPIDFDCTKKPAASKTIFLFSLKYHSFYFKTVDISLIFKKIIEIDYDLLINFWLFTF